MSTLGQRWQCLEEKTAVERVLLFLQHQQLQAGLGSHIGSKGKKSQTASCHSSVAPVWPSSGGEPRKALPKKIQKIPRHRL